MLSRATIAELVPHKGASVLLDRVVSWSREELVAATRSHLEAANPLRRAGRLEMLCGIEYGLQAAALHGALLNQGTPQPAGFLASLRNVALHAAFLDEPRWAEVQVLARLEHAGAAGMIYAFALRGQGGEPLVEGTGTIALAGRAP